MNTNIYPYRNMSSAPLAIQRISAGTDAGSQQFHWVTLPSAESYFGIVIVPMALTCAGPRVFTHPNQRNRFARYSQGLTEVTQK